MHNRCALDFKWIHVNATNRTGCAFHVNGPIYRGFRSRRVVQLAPPCFLFCAAVSQELIYAVLYHLAIGLSHYVQR